MRIFLSRLLPITVSFLIFSGGAAAAESIKSSAALAAIAERYFQDFVTLNPLSGSATLGEARFEDKLEISIAPAHKARSKALYQRVQRELSVLEAQVDRWIAAQLTEQKSIS